MVYHKHKDKQLLYFAYGSNMNHQQMRDRCPEGKFMKRVLLKGYKFVYDGYSKKRAGPVANVVESRGDVVYGGLFEISEKDLSELNNKEGYPKSYDIKKIEVKDEENNFYEAIVYFRTGKQPGEPSELYRKIVIRGAEDCNLPSDYIMNYL
ncbi:gamma-glutamylcyclotransferase family protein [candidate division KSB1 bacterium]